MTSLYKALNEEEVMKARFNLLKDGEYDAFVKLSSPRMSQAGNTMADMTLMVYDENGHSHEIRDFLVFSTKMLWKIKHFCDAASLREEYEEEKFVPVMAEGKNVRVKVTVQAGNEIPMDKLNGKPFGTRYPDKNVIEDYVTYSGLAMKPLPTVKDFFNDAIPF